MPGDEAQPEQGGTPQLRTGPRHAAPRKSLLTRVHVPAGKAIALAAMPTAVLMGMGLTPRLAQAAEPGRTFSGDHCVSQTDGPAAGTPSATATASASASPSATPTVGPSPSADPDGTPSAQGASPRASHTVSAPHASSAAAPKAVTAQQASVTRQSDPLGLGGLLDGLGGLLGGSGGSGSGSGGSGDAPSPSATPTPTASAPTGATPSPSATPTHRSGGGGGPAGTGGTATRERSGKAAQADPKDAKDAKDPQEADRSADGVPAAPSFSPGMPYPCPTYDARALADADLERTASLLPDQPWVLHSSLLTLTGLSYEGIVKVRTESGTVKDVLKFTATGVDIKDLHQIVQGPAGTLSHVEAAPGSTSTIRHGTVTMYTEELKGNLLGLIPVDFTPKSPPPLVTPVIFFSDVTVTQAGQFGGTLTVPGMHAYGTP